jgi:phosphonoacetaldehyde hydrolase
MSTQIKLIVLDWAGTSIDFGSCAPAMSFLKLFERAGVPVTIEEARRPMGLHKKDHIRTMLQDRSLSDAWTEEDVVALYEKVTPMQVEAAGARTTLTPWLLKTTNLLRDRGIRIAHTTGYFEEAAMTVTAMASLQGYRPDYTICADDVPAGRPAHWMIFRRMEACDVYPPAAVIKVGDTLIDIEDGRNAGVWSVGIVDPSNLMGLTEEEFAAVRPVEKDARRKDIRKQFIRAGAHSTIDTLAELPQLVDEINDKLKAGQKP